MRIEVAQTSTIAQYHASGARLVGSNCRPGSGRFRRLSIVDDALKLNACFERCYGDSYVAGHFYHPDELQRLRSKTLPRPNVVNPDAKAIFALIERDHRRFVS
jgi:hypothetical protein